MSVIVTVVKGVMLAKTVLHLIGALIVKSLVVNALIGALIVKIFVLMMRFLAVILVLRPILWVNLLNIGVFSQVVCLEDVARIILPVEKWSKHVGKIVTVTVQFLLKVVVMLFLWVVVLLRLFLVQFLL